MKISLNFFFIFLFSFAGVLTLSAQDEEEPQVIRVRKESNLAKAVFDNAEFRLMAIDRFGNPKENKIVSYKLWIKSRSTTIGLDGFNNSLTGEMINALKKQTKATKIFFTDITAQDDNGHPVKLPDVIDTWFPECGNCDSGKNRRR